MRSVSYVQCMVLEFSGSLFPHAICLGDVDNDTLNELVVGDTSRKVSVYKNDDSRPWLTCFCQGMLTCVGVGDICNKGKNLLVAVSAEGWFHLFDLTPVKVLDASGHHETPMGKEQRPVFKKHIPANTKVMLISDINGDGCCELVVGYTDRAVRAFRWEELGEGPEHLTGQLVSLKKWMLEGQVDSLSVTLGPLVFLNSRCLSQAVPMQFCCVDHQLFALEKLDVTGNGHEEVVACVWVGQTYIIDHNRTVVRFQVDENIRAFCAGLYACKEGHNGPCLVYITFNQKINVYWEVQLERMESTKLMKLLETKPEYHSLLQELRVDPDDLPVAHALLHQTLYHPDQPPQYAPSGLQDPT
ncbi:integrin alpha FG-GAP repeat-containing protein 2 [Saguinus oedipus]|uniref:Integrin alpha FG-GAP repeat-containing protein 2 n=1 Tax=Saguinus oedipus TaxID=9490 RepID=A0ABQ9TH14_SAGOE|nr:integrin alpha FG-GAP repeat-containing protein 2 [Saguinus oedipus]